MKQGIEVTSTTTSLTGPISSPSPYTCALNSRRQMGDSSGLKFTYNGSYPLSHCVKNTWDCTLDDLDMICTSEHSQDTKSAMEDKILWNLIVELGLDQMETLTELSVGHPDLSSVRVVRGNVAS